jgi:hypothetical protein
VTTRIALATCAAYPQIDDDAPLLAAALRTRGVEARPEVWTDDTVRWGDYDAVVVRGTWDYPPQLERFLAWADGVDAVTRLANAPQVLRWNTDKTYLRELVAAGVPVAETAWLEPGDEVTLPDAGEYVVKPAVSAGSKDTGRYVAGQHDARARDHARALLDGGRTVLVQPYLEAVDTYGETALLYFGGRFSHAIRKGPLLTPGMELVTGTYAEETVDPRDPTDDERQVAEAVLDAVPWDRESLAYARVDLVPSPTGAPVLLEIELAEPSMFLEHDTGAAERFAQTLCALVG